jgi:Macrocin-O-methyltransferase (TylF)
VSWDSDVAGIASRLWLAQLFREVRSRLWASPRVQLGFVTTNPVIYASYVPDRYSLSLKRYLAQGGSLDEEGCRKFAYGNGQNNAGDLTRYYMFRLIFDQLEKEGIRGDVAELGVYKGNTASLLVEFARRSNVEAYLLDTFEGFEERDLVGLDTGQPAQFSDTSIEEVKSLVGEQRVNFIKGHFPDSIRYLPGNLSFSIAHIDCDLGAPFYAALNYFYNHLARGGFLIMHDYSNLYWDGAERAIDTFFSDKPERLIPMPDKSGTVLVRKI